MAKRRTLTDPARYALQMLELLASWGIAPEAVLRRAGMVPGRLAQSRGDTRLTMDEVDALFGAARELAGRSDLAFEFGLRIKPTSHGLLGFALLGCSDVHALWQLAARQQYHLTEAFRLHYARAGGGGRVSYSPLFAMRPERLAFNLEVFAVTAHVTLTLLLGDKLPPYDIRLGMPAPPHHARYLALQPTRFTFDPSQPPGAVVTMDGAMLALPLPMAAPGIVRDVEQHLATLAPRNGAAGSWGEIVGQIVRQVRGRQVTLEGVAAQLGVSGRTLNRRLADEGVRFGELCDEVRFDSARALLRGGDLGVAQVAQALGYRDAANFSRAFQHHTDMSPSEFRATPGALDPGADDASRP